MPAGFITLTVISDHSNSEIQRRFAIRHIVSYAPAVRRGTTLEIVEESIWWIKETVEEVDREIEYEVGK